MTLQASSESPVHFRVEPAASEPGCFKTPAESKLTVTFVLKVDVEYLRVKTTVPCYFLSFEAAESKNKLQRSLNKLCDGDTT